MFNSERMDALCESVKHTQALAAEVSKAIHAHVEKQIEDDLDNNGMCMGTFREDIHEMFAFKSIAFECCALFKTLEDFQELMEDSTQILEDDGDDEGGIKDSNWSNEDGSY